MNAQKYVSLPCPNGIANRGSEPALLGTPQQEQLVAGIGERVEPFSQHCRRAADECGYKLHHGNARIGHRANRTRTRDSAVDMGRGVYGGGWPRTASRSIVCAPYD